MRKLSYVFLTTFFYGSLALAGNPPDNNTQSLRMSCGSGFGAGTLSIYSNRASCKVLANGYSKPTNNGGVSQILQNMNQALVGCPSGFSMVQVAGGKATCRKSVSITNTNTIEKDPRTQTWEACAVAWSVKNESHSKHYIAMQEDGVGAQEDFCYWTLLGAVNTKRINCRAAFGDGFVLDVRAGDDKCVKRTSTTEIRYHFANPANNAQATNQPLTSMDGNFAYQVSCGGSSRLNFVQNNSATCVTPNAFETFSKPSTY